MAVCEALVGAALFACLARDPACLPVEHRHLRDDLRAIAEQESRLHPWAVRVEASGTLPAESLFPVSHAEAVRIATERDVQGRILGLGWFQITHKYNWQRHGLTIGTALTPCASLRAGAAHYAGNIARALERVRSGALGDYNSGRVDGSPLYAAAVMRRVAAMAGGDGAMVAPPAGPVAVALPALLPPAWDVYAHARAVREQPAPSVVALEPPATQPEKPAPVQLRAVAAR